MVLAIPTPSIVARKSENAREVHRQQVARRMEQQRQERIMFTMSAARLGGQPARITGYTRPTARIVAGNKSITVTWEQVAKALEAGDGVANF